MSLQAQLNESALDYLPKIKELITNAPDFEANQMQHSAIRAMLNSNVKVVDMDSEQIAEFQTDMINYFKYMGWLK